MDDLGQRLIKDAEDVILSDDVNRFKYIREAMNSVYKHFKQEIKTANFRDENLLAIFKLERLMKNDFLPIDSEPIFDSNDGSSFPVIIQTEEDCQQALRFIVHKTRENLNRYRDVATDPLEGNCCNSSGFVENICEDYGVKCDSFSLNQDLSPGNFHCFDVISFDLPDGTVNSYFVDCTYRQFFTYSQSFFERIGLLLNEGCSIGAYMLMDEERTYMAEQILKNGYIEFNPETAKIYFDSFVFSGRNGKYYEKLGKQQLEKSDYEPDYTFEDYIYAINNRGLNEPDINRQREPLENIIEFDSDSVVPYLSQPKLDVESRKFSN